MYQVARELTFCYGHRLMQHAGGCRFLHGHNAVVVLTLAGETLNAGGMVADFQHIRDTLGAWIDATLDHRMILHRDDPAVPPLRELGEPLYLVDFHPTAENLARHLFERAGQLGLPVVEVRFWETAACYAAYTAHRT